MRRSWEGARVLTRKGGSYGQGDEEVGEDDGRFCDLGGDAERVQEVAARLGRDRFGSQLAGQQTNKLWTVTHIAATTQPFHTLSPSPFSKPLLLSPAMAANKHAVPTSTPVQIRWIAIGSAASSAGPSSSNSGAWWNDPPSYGFKPRVEYRWCPSLTAVPSRERLFISSARGKEGSTAQAQPTPSKSGYRRGKLVTILKQLWKASERE